MIEEYPPVLTKTDFVKRFFAGEFGNRGPTWNTLKEYLDSDYNGLMHIRNRQKGGPTYYNVPSAELLTKWTELGCTDQGYYLAAMAPTDKTTVQGEIMLGPRGLELYYSTVRKPMREALAESARQVRGLEAALILKGCMDPASYDWLQVLLERYDDPIHVIEFSCFSVNWGTICNRNTIIWELRSY